MVAKNEQFATILKQAGASLTGSRKHVFQALLTRHPVAMADLVELCKTHADRASVYRTIDLFEKLGIVQRVHVGWKYQLELGEAFNDHHHHATCRQCGAVISLHESPQLETVLNQIGEAHKFVIEHHQVEITGLCRTCNAISV